MANVWLMISNAKQFRCNRHKLHERIEEFDRATDLHIAELQGAKHRVDEAIAEVSRIKKSYDNLLAEHEELAKNYNSIFQKWENPSKTYLVNHIIKAYNVKNQTALANALGVSKSAITHILKKSK